MSTTTTRFLFLAGTLLVITACARTDSNGNPNDGSADSDTDADGGDTDADSDTDADQDWDIPPAEVLIYSHSRDTLFAFSAAHNVVVSEIAFTLSDGEPAPPMVDLAVNAAGEIYTSGYDSLFRVDPETGVTTLVGDFRDEEGQLLGSDLGISLYALTFVPRSLYPGRHHPGSPDRCGERRKLL